MVEKHYVIGVDGGTESLRAGVFDLKGHPLAFAAVPYPTHYPHPSWAEQAPGDWWRALGEAVREAVALAGVAPAAIAGLTVDTTCCTVVALDARGKPLRPAILWQDMRAAEQAAKVAATGDPAVAVNCGGAGPVSAEWMVPKALWLKEKEPEVFEKATYICEYQARRCAFFPPIAFFHCFLFAATWQGPLLAAALLLANTAVRDSQQDFIQFHLTGRMVASLNNVSVRWHYSTARGGWPASLLAALGLEGLAAKWPREVLPLGAAVGGLTQAAADHLGLPVGTVVGQGGADAFVGMLGLGVTHAGQMALLTGSSHLHLGLSNHAFGGAGIFGTYSDAVLPGLHVVEGGQTSTGSILNCRGAIAGLTLKHGRGHVFRALLESVCYGTEHVLEAMRGAGYAPAELRVAGGATKSPLWLQIHADVSNLPLQLTVVGEACVLGSAVLAAVAAGLHPSLEAAAGAMVELGPFVRPDPERHAAYAKHYEAYRRLYPQLQPCFHGLPAPAGGAAAAVLLAPPATRALLAAADVGPLRARVAPSILSADFARLAEEVNEVFVAGAEWVHVDIFDGNFVPTLTIGPPVVKSLRKHTKAFLDCHLCVLHPETYVEEMAAAGADQFIFHLEAVDFDYAKARALLADARGRGMRAGLALEIGTPVERLFPLLEGEGPAPMDVVLLLSVRAGFGGQKFNPAVMDKASVTCLLRPAQVRALRSRFVGDITVDGGIGAANAAEVAGAGANCLVAGSSVFCGPKPAADMVRDILGQAIAGLQQRGAAAS
eukprot:scaffold2.g7355.t1